MIKWMYGWLERNEILEKNVKIIFQFNSTFSLGIQGDDIGDVKFNSDGDGLGRYSVYQYQHMEKATIEIPFPTLQEIFSLLFLSVKLFL